MMRARFPGYCKAGRHAVAPGDEIGRDRGGWSHGPCLMRAPLDKAPNMVPFDHEAADAESRFDRALAANDRDRDNAEYAAGIEDANRERFNRQMFGESYAAAEEYARDMRGLNGEW